MADDDDEELLHPSDLRTIVGAKTPHHEEVHRHLTKDALMDTAYKMWRAARGVVNDDDDGICAAMHDALDAALVEGRRETERMSTLQRGSEIAEREAAMAEAGTRAQKMAYAAKLREHINDTRAELLT